MGHDERSAAGSPAAGFAVPLKGQYLARPSCGTGAERSVILSRYHIRYPALIQANPIINIDDLPRAATPHIRFRFCPPTQDARAPFSLQICLTDGGPHHETSPSPTSPRFDRHRTAGNGRPVHTSG